MPPNQVTHTEICQTCTNSLQQYQAMINILAKIKQIAACVVYWSALQHCSELLSKWRQLLICEQFIQYACLSIYALQSAHIASHFSASGAKLGTQWRKRTEKRRRGLRVFLWHRPILLVNNSLIYKRSVKGTPTGCQLKVGRRYAAKDRKNLRRKNITLTLTSSTALQSVVSRCNEVRKWGSGAVINTSRAHRSRWKSDKGNATRNRAHRKSEDYNAARVCSFASVPDKKIPWIIMWLVIILPNCTINHQHQSAVYCIFTSSDSPKSYLPNHLMFTPYQQKCVSTS